MNHLTTEECRLAAPLVKKYEATALVVGDALAEIMTTEKLIKNVTSLSNIISALFVAGFLVSYFKAPAWLPNILLIILFSYGATVYAFKHVMREKIERLNDKIDILLIDWKVEFGDDKHIQETIPKSLFVPAGTGYRFDTCNKAYDLWLSYHRREVYRRVLGRARASELCELELADIENLG